MSLIELREITQENWLDCVSLELKKEQKTYVASNAFSLAQASYEPNCWPLAVYHQTTMVGFVMCGRNDREQYWILRLMVDYRYQGRGYGKAALESAIAFLQTQPDCHDIFIDYVEGNTLAQKLYRSLGFVPTGEKIDREIVMRLSLKR
ncbi:MAG: GNAT family N-acetyltransferase [Desertifilum sp.]|nr:GNAT family N-acetyltransferase [Desertifilum sp.]